MFIKAIVLTSITWVGYLTQGILKGEVSL